MTDIIATAIADSLRDGPGDNRRLLTVRTRAPKFVHQETLRHRKIYCLDGLELWWEPDFSFSVSSSRAIPFQRMLAEASDPALRAAPVYWGEAQRGMSPGKELDDVEKCLFWPEVASSLGIEGDFGPFDRNCLRGDWISKRECARRLWDIGGELASRIAEVLVNVTDVHKSIANRMVENYVHANVLMTGTDPGWLNFFGLRLDGAADPTLRALAERCWVVWNESQPRSLQAGEWHLPYADDDRSLDEACNFGEETLDVTYTVQDLLKRMSVARSAHLSYEAHDAPGERMPVEKCLEIYQRLVGSVPIHASPAEHQATPDDQMARPGTVVQAHDWIWRYPELAGNLGPGWIQYRKTLPGEAVASLPEAYR